MRERSSLKVSLSRLIGIAIVLLLLAVLTVRDETYRKVAQGQETKALVVLSNRDDETYRQVQDLIQRNGGNVILGFHPNALIAELNIELVDLLDSHAGVAMITSDVLDSTSLESLSVVTDAARIWNDVVRAPPERRSLPPLSGPIQERVESGRVEAAARPGAAGQTNSPPGPYQTSEFMAGNIVVNTIFVESSGGAGNCSPAMPSTENWDTARQQRVKEEIATGLLWWRDRADNPSPITWVFPEGDGLPPTGPTSCEPINMSTSSSDLGKWFGDVLGNLYGCPVSPTGPYLTEIHECADQRRSDLGYDLGWSFFIFVVDSLNDVDGMFSDDNFAFAFVNGPLTVLTYDNGGWEIDRMHWVAAHEVGHVFGASDEYVDSGCTTAQQSGYFWVNNSSCNNGGITSDISIMGPSTEIEDPSVDISTSARDAIGWRNPTVENGKTVVDAVRTSYVALNTFVPDPTGFSRLAYSGLGLQAAFPPGGSNAPVSISWVDRVFWQVDGGPQQGALPQDFAWGGQVEEFWFDTTPLSDGKRVVGAWAVNQFGDGSSVSTDSITVDLTDTDVDGCADLRELQTASGSEISGGLRDPNNPWDFYDVPSMGGAPPDGEIDLFIDILGVIQHYSLDGSPPYDVQFDRGRGEGAGPDPWNMTGPDGAIDLFIDILGVIAQYGHDCT